VRGGERKTKRGVEREEDKEGGRERKKKRGVDREYARL